MNIYIYKSKERAGRTEGREGGGVGGSGGSGALSRERQSGSGLGLSGQKNPDGGTLLSFSFSPFLPMGTGVFILFYSLYMPASLPPFASIHFALAVNHQKPKQKKKDCQCPLLHTKIFMSGRFC